MAIQGFKVRSQTLIDKDESGNGQHEDVATQWIRRRGLMTVRHGCVVLTETGREFLLSCKRKKEYIYRGEAGQRSCIHCLPP